MQIAEEKKEDKKQVDMKPQVMGEYLCARGRFCYQVTASGKYRCCHVGCGKEYDPEDNSDSCCHYHDGK